MLKMDYFKKKSWIRLWMVFAGVLFGVMIVGMSVAFVHIFMTTDKYCYSEYNIKVYALVFGDIKSRWLISKDSVKLKFYKSQMDSISNVYCEFYDKQKVPSENNGCDLSEILDSKYLHLIPNRTECTIVESGCLEIDKRLTAVHISDTSPYIGSCYIYSSFLHDEPLSE